MIVRLAVDEDKEGWNRVASMSVHATYAHLWEWAEIIERGLGFRALKLVAENNSQIVGIYSGFLKPYRSKFVLFSPLDTTWDYGGPVCLPGDERALGMLIEKMEVLAKSKRVISLRVSPYRYAELEELLATKGYRRSERLTCVVDVTVTEDEILGNIKKGARRNISKAEGAGVRIVESDSLDDTRKLREILGRHSKDSAYGMPPVSYFEYIHEIMVKNKLARVHLAYLDDEVIGGGLSFVFGKTATLRYAGIVQEHRDSGAHYLLHWHRILQFKKEGVEEIDMGGIPPEEKNGVRFFKTRFGGTIIPVDWLVKDLYLPGLRAIKRRFRKK